ncbi:hypothetical protein BDZ85DRAFT_56886 [Elsinoe ampelina]|uniref:tRNA wybutosine-synthesizing protein 4 n=1 Tax=Elsinoe ampelina TaxID=302913 RepID=A0A6A6GNC6_9PEZI|nr:hypothetical protein BDZ85DRAFT_56886 [Elsinoe ampelina]
MFENDSIQAFHQKQLKKPLKMQALGVPTAGKKDEFIMDTNSSSIVSKRSVEKLYYPHQPEYFRYFVRKFQRRSPLINRGYWLRMKAIEKTVADFLQEDTAKTKVVVNLGCGYDPLPFQFLGIHPEKCQNCVFVDVDYPQLMHRKLEVIRSNQPILDVLPGITYGNQIDPLLASAEKYKAVGCDLKNVANLDSSLRQFFDLESCSITFLFVAEVSVAYMEKPAANAVLSWAAKLPDSRFCLLEQHLPDGPDHPFAETMLKHFQKLRTPLHAIGTLAQMRERFVAAGWPADSLDMKTLWELWSDDNFLKSEERRHLDSVEPFDEWEEFALFGAHYFLLRASNRPTDDTTTSPKSKPADVATSSNSLDSSQVALRSQIIQRSPQSRRFAAAAPLLRDTLGSERDQIQGVAIWGGLGTRERLKGADVFVKPAEGNQGAGGNTTTSNVREPTSVVAADLPTALMCHTITSLANGQLLLAGGRTAPDKASSSCWLLQNSSWKSTHALPTGRYRHCAIQVGSARQSDCSSAVLIFGGKTSQGQVLDNWSLFSPDKGWETIKVAGRRPEARFGATMTVKDDGLSGALLGGMRNDGTIILDQWSWRLAFDPGAPTLHCERREGLDSGLLERLCRFGAQTARFDGKDLIIGGVAAGSLLDSHNEIMSLSDGVPVAVKWEARPLVTGLSVITVGEEIVSLGGGATCFSFGTFWNTSQVLRTSTSGGGAWEVQGPSIPHRTVGSFATAVDDTAAVSRRKSPSQVPRKTLSSPDTFQAMLLASQPAIIEGLDLGPCLSKWTPQYLKDTVGHDRNVVIHDSGTPKMNFQSKNFAYKTVPFGTFLDDAEGGRHVYLRALSSDRPADKPTELATDFPTIAPDFKLPSILQYVSDHAHSSPLRISGPVNMWLHYDVMANVLCQIKGSKRLLLYPPSDVIHLGIPPGGSSSSIDPFDPSPDEQSILAKATPYEAILNEGDVLFIPPLWLHTAKPSSNLSVAVNVFFRDERMEQAYAAGKDVYGNRDIAAFERGRKDVQKIAKQFDGLPEQIKAFYLRRLANELHDLA